MSRAAWYRQNKHRKTGETTLSAAIFLIPNDEPVSGEELGNRAGLRPKEKKEAFRLATATTLAADRYATLPLELRMAALCLPMPGNLARAA